VLQKKVTALLKKIQGEGLDPIGFGLHYRSRHWNNDTEWDTWQKLYPDIRFTVQAKVKIQSTGLIR
ncbi:MAG: Ger(x)C family spore germination C-terminal domain-containing protein, partial [Bacillota bacterium]|nr:Ger(x)C family spore germination C-terminal domain-containing protein [Bacillota bacterium]